MAKWRPVKASTNNNRNSKNIKGKTTTTAATKTIFWSWNIEEKKKTGQLIFFTDTQKSWPFQKCAPGAFQKAEREKIFIGKISFDTEKEAPIWPRGLKTKRKDFLQKIKYKGHFYDGKDSRDIGFGNFK